MILTSSQHQFGDSLENDHLGIGEVAGLLGVSRQRLHGIRRAYPDFPPPAETLSCGPIWHAIDVDAWVASHRSRPVGIHINDTVCALCGVPREVSDLTGPSGERLACPTCGGVSVNYSRAVHEAVSITDQVSYTAHLALPEPSWREQWDRIARSRRRLEVPIAGPIGQQQLVEHRDRYLRLFQEIHAFTDWVRNDSTSLVSDARAVVKSSIPLKLAAALANGSKHMKPLTSGGIDATTRASTAVVTSGANPAGAEVHYLITAYGRDYEATDVADKAIQDWRTALIRSGENLA
jgi:hypothetical protein